jgi:hypothetical protein
MGIRGRGTDGTGNDAGGFAVAFASFSTVAAGPTTVGRSSAKGASASIVARS